MARALGAITIAAALSLLSPPLARAYRPFLGTDAGVAGRHRLEVEFGPLGSTRTGDERLLIAPELILTYGAGSGFEFGLGARRLMRMSPDPDGVEPSIDDIEFTVGKLLKAGTLQNKQGVSLFTEGAVLIPSTTRHQLGAEFLLAASRSWDDAAFHLSGEVSRTSEGDPGRFASLIAEGPDRWELRPIAEASLEREADESTMRALLLGLIWQTRAGLAMDFSYRFGYSDERLAEFRSGITWNRHISGPHLP